MKKSSGIILLAVFLVIGFGTVVFAQGGYLHHGPHHHNEMHHHKNDQQGNFMPCHDVTQRGHLHHHQHHPHHHNHGPHHFNR